MKYSKYQKDIFKFVKTSKESCIVQAVAGSGKTTTAIESMKLCKGDSIFLAFNKSIATELQERGVNGRTFHSVCFNPIKTRFRIRNIEFDKVRIICKDVLSWEEMRNYYVTINKLVGLGKQSGVGVLVGYDEFRNLFFDHNIQLETSDSDLETLFRLTRLVFDESVRDKTMCDFDDMLYWTVSEKLNLKTYDNIFVDEVQDTNAIQRQILKQMCNSKTRIFALGDKYQSIYRFRGSDSNAMELFKREFNCVELPLSISYRCPKSVVKYAQVYNNSIQAAPNAKDGEVTTPKTFNVSQFKSNDMVLCRTTKPIVKLAYTLLNNKVPVSVMGRDIGKGLKSLVTKLTPSHGGTIAFLVHNLEVYRGVEVKKLRDLDKESQIEAINDKVDTILALCEGLNVDEDHPEKLLQIIDNLFKERKNAVILSTIHKAKGLEAKRVFWLNYNDCPAPWAKGDEDRQQELNLCYVAITRAKESLILLSELGIER